MFAQRRKQRLDALVADHGLAMRTFIDRAHALDASQWLEPRAEGKWTPAQETKHVLLSYDEFMRQLLAALRLRAQEFDAAFARTWREEPRRRMSHYLFGKLSLDQAIRLVSVHTRHHAAFLPVKTPGSSSVASAVRS